MSRHTLSLHLVVSLTLSVFHFGNGVPHGFSLHMGVINGPITDPVMKYRWFDSDSFEEGSSSSADYTSAMDGSFTAMKSLVTNQLGFNVTNLFYRNPEKSGDKLFELTTDRDLGRALSSKFTDLDIYACRNSNVPCFTMIK